MIISKVSFLSEKFVFLQAYLKVVQLSIFMDVEVAFCQSGYSLALSVALFLEREGSGQRCSSVLSTGTEL